MTYKQISGNNLQRKQDGDREHVEDVLHRGGGERQSENCSRTSELPGVDFTELKNLIRSN
jgi:hypothetical protein